MKFGRTFYKHNYCPACHTRFVTFFPSGCCWVKLITASTWRTVPLLGKVTKLRACLHGVEGPRSSGVGFFCFHALADTKQKKPTPLDRGPPLHVNRVLLTIKMLSNGMRKAWNLGMHKDETRSRCVWRKNTAQTAGGGTWFPPFLKSSSLYYALSLFNTVTRCNMINYTIYLMILSWREMYKVYQRF